MGVKFSGCLVDQGFAEYVVFAEKLQITNRLPVLGLICYRLARLVVLAAEADKVSIFLVATIYKRQTRPLTASGCWTGFLFLRIVSDLRRF
jgi:hypothetical protein